MFLFKKIMIYESDVYYHFFCYRWQLNGLLLASHNSLMYFTFCRNSICGKRAGLKIFVPSALVCGTKVKQVIAYGNDASMTSTYAMCMLIDIYNSVCQCYSFL